MAAFVGKLSKNPRLCKSTVAAIKCRLSQVLKAAVADGVIVANPAASVTTPKAQAKHALSVTQVELLATKVPDAYRVLVLVLAYCGLRPSEAAALQRRDINLDAGTIHVHAAIVEGEGGILERAEETKNRRIPPVPVTADVLAELANHMAKVAPAASAAVFASRRGHSFRVSIFRRTIQATAATHDLPDWVASYALRHTCATILARQRVPVHVAAAFMGHDPAVFLRIYAHLFDSDRTAAAAAIGRARSDQSIAKVVPINRVEIVG